MKERSRNEKRHYAEKHDLSAFFGDIVKTVPMTISLRQNGSRIIQCAVDPYPVMEVKAGDIWIK